MRKPRIQFEGALYHVIVRGNQRRRVYLDPPDHCRYLEIMGKKAPAHAIKIYAYCLMPNHAHLLLEQTGYPKLSRYMQGLQTAYTKYFNKKHKQVGHLFQGRYKALLMERDSYLLELVRYIHLNPKRAHLEERVGEYPWTSHAQYLGKEKKPLVRVSKEALGMFRSKAPEKAYNKFVLAGIGEGHRRDLYETSGWQILGPDGYAARMLSKISERPERPFKLNMGFVEIWAKIKGRERLGGEPIGRSRRRLISEAVWVAVNGRGETQTKIACYLDMTQSGISRALNGLEERFKKDPNERRRLVSWARSLKKS